MEPEWIRSFYEDKGEAAGELGLELYRKLTEANAESVTICYTLTPEDVRQCVLREEKRNPKRIWQSVLLAVLALLFLGGAAVGKSLQDLLLGILCGALCGLVWGMPWIAAAQAAKAQGMERPRRFITIGDRVVYSSDGESFFQFQIGKDPLELRAEPDFYLFKGKRQQFHCVPRRDLTPQEEARIQAILDRIQPGAVHK